VANLSLGISVALSIGMVAGIEYAGWLALFHEPHSALSNANEMYRRANHAFSKFVMAALVVPFFLAWLRSINLGRKMAKFGADAFSVLQEKQEIFGDLAMTYLVILLCVNALAR